MLELRPEKRLVLLRRDHGSPILSLLCIYGFFLYNLIYVLEIGLQTQSLCMMELLTSKLESWYGPCSSAVCLINTCDTKLEDCHALMLCSKVI
jgi:hypothetical protein